MISVHVQVNVVQNNYVIYNNYNVMGNGRAVKDVGIFVRCFDVISSSI